MSDRDNEIHIMDGDKISKNFIIAVIGVSLFVLVIGYISYVYLHRYDVFLEKVKEQRITSIKSEAPIEARHRDCPYQVHFEGVNSSGQKIKARYCGNNYSFGGNINIKEILKD